VFALLVLGIGLAVKVLFFKAPPPPAAPQPRSTVVVTVSPPRPALVALNGEVKGKLAGGKDSSSLTLGNLKPGLYQLVVKSEGFPNEERSLTIGEKEVKVIVA